MRCPLITAIATFLLFCWHRRQSNFYCFFSSISYFITCRFRNRLVLLLLWPIPLRCCPKLMNFTAVYLVIRSQTSLIFSYLKSGFYPTFALLLAWQIIRHIFLVTPNLRSSHSTLFSWLTQISLHPEELSTLSSSSCSSSPHSVDDYYYSKACPFSVNDIHIASYIPTRKV